MIPGLIAAGGSQLLGGILGGIIGGGQVKKGKKLLKNLQYPEEQLPQEYLDNQNLAKEMAAEGLPAEQYSKAMRDIQRNQLTAFRSAKDRRGGLGSIPSILQTSNDATTDLNARDAVMRNQNRGTLLTVNNQIGNVKRDLFDKNKRDKYIRDYQYGMGLIGAGRSNVAGGLDRGAAGIGTGLYGLLGKEIAA